MIAPGTTLGRYTVRKPLGAGGMGEVYVAFDPELERAVALKVLPADLAGDAARVARFVREAKAASALNHPNILTVFDAGTHDDIRFLVTELVDGQTLREWTEHERPSLSEILDVMTQAASALAAAHEVGIVHRDVKPENLMRRRDGLVKVLDFGIAKLSAAPAAAVETGAITAEQPTQPGAVLGHRPLHVARTGVGLCGRRPLGRLEPGRRSLRARRRTAAVRGRERDLDSRSHPRARSRAARAGGTGRSYAAPPRRRAGAAQAS